VTDKQLLKIVRGYRNGMLGEDSSNGWCFMLCMPLISYLSVHGVKGAVLMESETETCNHVWILLEDGRVLDPTADQFGKKYPKVYLGEPLDIHANPRRYS
jgi:hypothetical protein